MKTILLISSTSHAYFLRSAQKHLQGYTIMHDCYRDILQEGVTQYITRKVEEIRSGEVVIEGLWGSGERTCSIAAVIAHCTGKHGPSLPSVLFCQNKYISRLRQRECISQHTPAFFLASKRAQCKIFYPFFVKPVCSSMSVCVQSIHSLAEFDEFLTLAPSKIATANKPYRDLISLGHFTHTHIDTYNDFICEELLTGSQVNVDGYVFDDKVVFWGLTKAHFLPGTISFSRFDYPYSFGALLDKHIYDIARKLITGFGLNNTCFNIELKVNAETGDIAIIEVHARLAVQFASLIERVTGYNPVRAACDIACGIDPGFEHWQAKGTYKVCCSCVLRRESDALVCAVSSKKEIEHLEQRYGDVEIIARVEKGKRLSAFVQDSDTFRYALLTIPGQNIEEVQQICRAITKELSFRFAND